MTIPELPPAAWQSGLLLLVAGMVLCGIPGQRRMMRFTSSALRLSTYRKAALALWVYALLALLLTWPADLFTTRHAAAQMAGLLGSPLAAGSALLVVIGYFSLAFLPILHCGWRPAAREKYRAAVQPLLFIMPVSPQERRWWIVLSLSAGVCEEVLFRGFLPQFLQGDGHGGWQLQPALAWLMSSLLFGCGHLYQGMAGVMRTALAGLMFSLLAILSGSLLLPILLHVLIDLGVLWLYRPQQDNPAEADRLVQGGAPGACTTLS